MIKFGIKIPVDLFEYAAGSVCEKLCDSFGGRDGYFKYLKSEIDTVEISMVKYKITDPDTLLSAVTECKKYGFEVSLHGSGNGVSCGEEFYKPYLPLFEAGLQSSYNITLHPFECPQKTEELLRGICEEADKMDYPVRITLENQRFANENLINTRCRNVAEIVKNINHPRLYTCFDFGHQLSNEEKQGKEFDIPDHEFIETVRHTHIHAYYNGSTHFPLSCGKTMLERNITKLIECGYDDVFLLELVPERYYNTFDIKQAVIDSISVLKTAYHQIMQKKSAYSEYADNYAEYLQVMKKGLEKIECGMILFAPAMYIIKIGKTKLAVDPSFWELPLQNDTRCEIIRIVSQCDAVIFTHAHRDHYDKELLSSLPTSTLCLMPDFMQCDRENVMYTKDGYYTEIGNVKIEFFNSAHESNNNGVKEYGFALKCDGKYYVFPTDIRNYCEPHRVFPNTEVLVSHLWMGSGNALNLTNNVYIKQFCDFVNGFDAKKIYISHLFDYRRDITNMWSDIHYNEIKEKLNNPQMIKMGEIIEFQTNDGGMI